MEPSEILTFSRILAFFLLFMIPFRMDHVLLEIRFITLKFFLQHAFSRLFLANDSLYFCNVYNMIHYAPILFSDISYMIYFVLDRLFKGIG